MQLLCWLVLIFVDFIWSHFCLEKGRNSLKLRVASLGRVQDLNFVCHSWCQKASRTRENWLWSLVVGKSIARSNLQSESKIPMYFWRPCTLMQALSNQSFSGAKCWGKFSVKTLFFYDFRYAYTQEKPLPFGQVVSFLASRRQYLPIFFKPYGRKSIKSVSAAS